MGVQYWVLGGGELKEQQDRAHMGFPGTQVPPWSELIWKREPASDIADAEPWEAAKKLSARTECPRRSCIGLKEAAHTEGKLLCPEGQTDDSDCSILCCHQQGNGERAARTCYWNHGAVVTDGEKHFGAGKAPACVGVQCSDWGTSGLEREREARHEIQPKDNIVLFSRDRCLCCSTVKWPKPLRSEEKGPLRSAVWQMSVLAHSEVTEALEVWRGKGPLWNAVWQMSVLVHSEVTEALEVRRGKGPLWNAMWQMSVFAHSEVTKTLEVWRGKGPLWNAVWQMSVLVHSEVTETDWNAWGLKRERPITKYNKMVELVLFLSDRSAEVFLKGCEVEGARGGFFGPGNP